MKNIHVLSTDKASRLYSWEDKLTLGTLATTPFNKNIYITSDEEIKTGDWYINTFVSEREQKPQTHTEKGQLINHKKDYRFKYCEKIILTDNQDLIKDGVQAIDDEFLEWFIKNPSCESVGVKKEYITPLGDIVETCYDNERLNYKIIIPKEEPKQETPEEVKLAILFHNTYEKLAPSFGYETREDTKSFDITTPNGKLMIAVCKEIIKWQQERMYSEEEAFEMMSKCPYVLPTDIKNWYEQFKNK